MWMTILRSFALLCGLVATTGHADDMTFYFTGNGGNCHGCEWIEARGEITPDTPARFIAFAETLNGAGGIALDSTGGDPDAAMALGRAIRERDWDTSRREQGGEFPSRETTCIDACVLAFMGGVGRNVRDDHGLTIGGETAVQWVSQDVLEYTLEMGVSPDVLMIATRVPAGQTYDVVGEDLTRLGLDNTQKTTDDWYLEPYKEGLVLATKQQFGPTREVPFTLFCRVEDPRLHILVVEPGDFTDTIFPDGSPLNYFSVGDYADGPAFTIGEAKYPLDPDDVDFIRQSQTGLTVSVILPDAVIGRPGGALSFTPNLGRVYAGLLEYTIPLPPSSWIEAALRNCI